MLAYKCYNQIKKKINAQALGLVPLIFGIIAQTSSETIMTLINYILDMKYAENSINITEPVKTVAIYLIILGIVIVGIAAFGLLAACYEIQLMLSLVSQLVAATVLL